MSLLEAIKQSRRPLAALRHKREHEASDLRTNGAGREPCLGSKRQQEEDGEERASSGQGAGPSGRPCAKASTAFYDAGERLRHAEDRVLRFLAAVQARLAGAAAAPAPYASFPTQAPALEYADARSTPDQELRVFSAEVGPSARRRFVATSVAELWRRYAATPPPLRHWYEIIREGAPCNLYFDLEFARAANPGAAGAAAVEALLALTAQLLRERFGVEMEPRWALELDSTTAAKFSRHLILRIPGAAFASNAHAGIFVRELCARAEAAAAGGDERAALLRVLRSDGSRGSIVDAGVYTRNRAFRLYLSSKAGKEAVLQLTDRFGGAALGSAGEREVFLASLVCGVPEGARLLRCFEEDETSAAAAGAGRQTRPGARRPGGGGGGAAGHAAAGPDSAAHFRYGPSPYPALEEFVTSVCREGGAQGRVRCWAVLDDVGVALFSMAGNRFCGNVGRAHRSNGIYYVVNLAAGWWFQRCYDPDCRAYRSPPTALPQHLHGLWAAPPAAAPPGGDTWAEEEEGAGGEGWEEQAEEDAVLLSALLAYEQRQQGQGAAGAAGPEQQQQQWLASPAAASPPAPPPPPAAAGEMWERLLDC